MAAYYQGETAEKLKRTLSAKLDSKDKFIAALSDAGVDDYFTRSGHSLVQEYPPMLAIGTDRYNGLYKAGAFTAEKRDSYWWLERELLRSEYRVYAEPTEPLRLVRDTFRLHQYHPHISTEDPTLIAYTPSVEAGMADKQVRISFAKFLRKMCLMLSDKHIQTLEQLHRAEMDPTFFIARTQDEIEHVYTNMQGDSGCMRYPRTNWPQLPCHPSAVYSYPGVGVAYTKAGDDIMARAVIYENPDDPTDKRYVRLYGDPSLRRKLERAGYRAATLEGAKLRRIPVPGLEGSYVMPYLDGVNGSRDPENLAVWAVTFKGEDYIKVLTLDQSASYRTATGKYIPECRNTDGRIKIPEIDLAAMQGTCALSGLQFNRLEDEAVDMYIDGEIRPALADKVADISRVGANYLDEDGERKTCSVRTEDVERHVFLNNGVRWLNRDREHMHVGHVRLSEKYGYSSDWVASYDTTVVKDTEGNEHRVHTADTAYMLLEGAEYTQRMHISEYEARRKDKAYVTALAYAGIKVLAFREHPKLVTTVSGKRVVTDLHGVVPLYDGRWEFENQSLTLSVLGSTLYRSKKDGDTPVRVTREWMQPIVDSHLGVLRNYGHSSQLAEAQRWNDARIRTLLTRTGTGCFFYKRGDLLRMATSGLTSEQVSIAEVRAGIAQINSMSDTELTELFYPGAVFYARQFAYVAGLFLELYCPAADEHLRSLEATNQPAVPAPAAPVAA